jgi:hypothetical protein
MTGGVYMANTKKTLNTYATTLLERLKGKKWRLIHV